MTADRCPTCNQRQVRLQASHPEPESVTPLHIFAAFGIAVVMWLCVVALLVTA